MLCTSCEGFHDISKITTRLAATKLIPKPPARVDIKNNLKKMEHKNQYFILHYNLVVLNMLILFPRKNSF